jgi:hypothetical protein
MDSSSDAITRRDAIKKTGLFFLGLGALAKGLYGKEVELGGSEYTNLMAQIYAKVQSNFSKYIFGQELKEPLKFDIDGDHNPDIIKVKQRDMGMDTPVLMMDMSLSSGDYVDFRAEVKNGKFRNIFVNNASPEDALKYLTALKEKLYK